MFSSAAAGTVTFGTGAAAGNLGVLVVENANEAFTPPSGWTTLDVRGFGTGGAAGGEQTTVCYKLNITSGDVTSGIAIADTGDHQNAILLTFTGHDTTTPLQVPFTDVASGATTAVSIATLRSSGVTVTAYDLALAVIGTDRDSATVSTNASAAWANIAGSNSFIANFSSATGAGGGIIVNQLTPSANQTGDTTFSCTITSSAWAGLIVVVKAPPTSFPVFSNPLLPLLVR